jgi:formate hydrogenlyase transcriptional activator
MQAIRQLVGKILGTDLPVLIQGENGTGKGLIAQYIHSRSVFYSASFVKVNCAAIPGTLLESELFGHEKGAFTGATQLRRGRFELAHQGTIFLDEIGEVPAETQLALLRVLQERQIERIGGGDPIPVDVRVIAATNRDLSAAVTAGTFRADLFYRLNVFPIDVPPLRQRQEDIALLVEYFVRRFAEKMKKRIRRIDERALERCKAYPWPGNIRELQNVVERAVILCAGEMVDIDLLSIAETPERKSRPRIGDALSLEDVERSHIRAVMASSASFEAAAMTLGIDVSTLYRKRKEYGL